MPHTAQPTSCRLWLPVAWLVLAAALSGCASADWVTLREVPKNPLADQLKLFAPSGPRPTDRTQLLLRRFDLESEMKDDPSGVLAKLQAIFEREPSSDKLYSMAELAYLGGKKAEPTNTGRALTLHGVAVRNAYLYLFDERFGPWRNAYDPQFRGACDLYNGALESVLRIVQKEGRLKPGLVETIGSGDQALAIAAVARGGWQADDFDRFEFVSDYKINGLENHYHNYGLGVPLIAVRKKRPPREAVERYYPPGLSYPVTAFLRVLPRKEESAAGTRQAQLELHDPLNTFDLVAAGRRVPLESDLSTPLAFLLNQPQLRDLDQSTAGLLNPGATDKLKGLYMLEPYQPGKIPVLMIHGIWSSPITWMEMFNDLRSAPEIRDHFQFWFYLYPSGQPFWYSAAQLRGDLAQMRAAIDPQRQEAALDQMVLVGHSMGGLLATLQTVDSGSDFWRVLSDKPFENLKAPAEVRQSLASTFFFQPNPSVRQVITIGTPYRGSRFANETTRWLGSKLITLPTTLVMGKQQVDRDNPGLFRSPCILDVSSSIESLAPSSPILPVVLSARRGQWVQYHNVVGNIPEKGFVGRVAGGTDGVVSSASAHLEGAASEVEVNCDHVNLHRHPRTVMEVHRVLLEHLAQLPWEPEGTIERLPATAAVETPQDPREIRASQLPRGTLR